MADTIEYNLINKSPDPAGQVLVPVIEQKPINSAFVPNQQFPDFKGKTREMFQLYLPEKNQRVTLLGLGQEDQLSSSFQSFRYFGIKSGQGAHRELLVDLSGLPSEIIYQCVLGLSLSSYSPGVYKTIDPVKRVLQKVSVLVSQVTDELDGLVNQAANAASVIKRVCALVDAPANIKTPHYLGQWALQSGEKYGYQVEVLGENSLKEEKLMALMAVGQGSQHPPRLIKAVYKHPSLDASSIDLGLVGKGVTFDTGGISIKKPANMHYMKSDMAGAAAVMGAMELIARLKLKLNVTAVVPLAENSVDAAAIRPGDVIQSHSGKSIEIIDTDAEGRLILADAISYIQTNYQPKILIDLATLTGNCVAALGYEAAGLFSNDLELVNAISKAGEETTERVWGLPLWDAYADALDSDVADVKNLSPKPVAGAITAAKFLEYFVNDHQRWAHLDIAGVAFGDTDYAKMKSATGYGVRLLVQFARTLE